MKKYLLLFLLVMGASGTNQYLGFYAPLVANLDLEVGKGEATFTRSTAGTVKDYLGNLVTCEINEARFEGARRISEGVWSAYEVDGVTVLTTLRGILIEEQRENEITYSEALDNATGGWTETAVTSTLNFTIGPDGVTSNATRIVPDVGTGVTGISKAIAGLSDDTVYTASIFVKRNDYQWVRISHFAKSGASVTSWFDVQNAAKGTVNHTYSRVESFGSSWCRISVGHDIASGGSTPVVQVRLADGDTVFTGTGDGLKYNLFFGIQVEEGAFPTSYAKTVASTVTRTKDVLWYPAAGNINEAQGAFVVDFSAMGIVNNAKLLSINTNASSNRHYLYLQTTSSKILYGITDGGELQASMNAGTDSVILHSSQSIGGRYTINDAKVFVDGSAGGLDTSLDLPTELTHIYIGSGSLGNSQLNGTVKEVKIFKKKLSDSQMETLTVWSPWDEWGS